MRVLAQARPHIVEVPKVTPQKGGGGQDSHLALRADHGIVVHIVDVDGHDGWLVRDGSRYSFLDLWLVAHPPRDLNSSYNNICWPSPFLCSTARLQTRVMVAT